MLYEIVDLRDVVIFVVERLKKGDELVSGCSHDGGARGLRGILGECPVEFYFSFLIDILESLLLVFHEGYEFEYFSSVSLYILSIHQNEIIKKVSKIWLWYWHLCWFELHVSWKETALGSSACVYCVLWTSFSGWCELLSYWSWGIVGLMEGVWSWKWGTVWVRDSPFGSLFCSCAVFSFLGVIICRPNILVSPRYNIDEILSFDISPHFHTILRLFLNFGFHVRIEIRTWRGLYILKSVTGAHHSVTCSAFSLLICLYQLELNLIYFTLFYL